MIINTKLGKKATSASSIFAYGGLASTDTVHCVKGLLPYEYQELTYIQSTGTQYIDTGLGFNASTDELEVEFYIPTALGNNPLLGGGYYSTSNGEIIIGNLSSSTPTFDVISFLSSATLFSFDNSISQSSLVGSWHTVSISSKTPSVDTTTGTEIKNVNTQFNTFLFAHNRNGTIVCYGQYRVKRYEQTRNGSLVRNFIPCYEKSSGDNGLYDTVEGKFYANQASSGDDFTRGTEVTTTSYTGTWTSKTISSVVENGWLFSDITTLGTYTVSATRSSTTITENVLIDAIADYDVEMEFS